MSELDIMRVAAGLFLASTTYVLGWSRGIVRKPLFPTFFRPGRKRPTLADRAAEHEGTAEQHARVDAKRKQIRADLERRYPGLDAGGLDDATNEIVREGHKLKGRFDMP